MNSNSYQIHAQLKIDREFRDTDLHNSHQLHHHHQNNNSGLMRYRSAPSSFLASLVDEDLLQARTSSPEESIFSRFMSCNGSSETDSQSHDLREIPESLNGYSNSSHSMYQNAHSTIGSGVSMQSGSMQSASIEGAFSVRNPIAMDVKSGGGNSSNLVRQSSSPPGFFANLAVENGFTTMRNMGSFKPANSTNGETKQQPSRLSNHMNFSPARASSPSLMPQIAEIENECIVTSSPMNGSVSNGIVSNGHSHISYMPSLSTDPWDETSYSTGLKRMRDNDGIMFSGLNSLDNKNRDSGNRVSSLIHHLSLPKTSNEMAAVEKYLHFQDSVPCKIRAKRGFATHPRSIAERVRRTRISERMRKLQELFPNMDKQTNTADMLDWAVEYIKDLQKQVKTMTDTRAQCTCSTKQKQFQTPTA